RGAVTGGFFPGGGVFGRCGRTFDLLGPALAFLPCPPPGVLGQVAVLGWTSGRGRPGNGPVTAGERAGVEVRGGHGARVAPCVRVVVGACWPNASKDPAGRVLRMT